MENRERRLFWLTTLLVISTLAGLAGAGVGPVTTIPSWERQALIAFYNSTGGDDWYDNSGWKQPPLAPDGFAIPGTEGFWAGVSVDPTESTVIALQFPFNNLTGHLPSEIGDLTNLLVMIIYENPVGGPIPASIGNLSKMFILEFAFTNITGPIPPEIGNLTDLEGLALVGCPIDGPLPAEIGRLSNLYELVILDCPLSGPIPPEIANLSQLEILVLNVTGLSGEIPRELGNLSQLWVLDLSTNQLSGPIPDSLGNLIYLEEFYLNGNRLSGEVPYSFTNLFNLGVIVTLGSSGDTSNQLESYPQRFIHTRNWSRISKYLPIISGKWATLNQFIFNKDHRPGSGRASLNKVANSGPSGGLDLRWNALYTSNDYLRYFLNENQYGGDWESTQTITPIQVTTFPESDTSVLVSWQPITYQENLGGYEVFYALTPDGHYNFYGITPNKMASSMSVTGLIPGQEYSFYVKALTYPHEDYFFLFNKVESLLPIFGEGNPFNTVESEPSLVVTCTPTGDGNLAPGITGFPTDRAVCPGALAHLEVTASGTPPLTYQWYQGESSDTDNELMGETTPVLDAPPFGKYWVRITNPYGMLDSPAVKVTIASSPTIDVQPQDTEVAPGQPATLWVAASGDTLLLYQWYAGDSGDETHPISGATGAVFTSSPLTAGASYWVKVTASCGSINSRTAMVQVVCHSPVVTTQPKGGTVPGGKRATLTVVVSGTGPLAYQWYLGDSGDTSHPVSGATGSGFLTPPMVSETHYWVRVSGLCGVANSDTAILIPKYELYGAYLQAFGESWTRLTLVNHGSTDQPVQLEVYSSGQPQPAARHVLDHLAPGAVFTSDIRDIFPGMSFTDGCWLKVTSASGVAGVLTFGSNQGGSRAAIPLVDQGGQDLVFPDINAIAAADGAFGAVIALANLASAEAQLTLDAYDPDGTHLASAARTLPPLGQMTEMLSGLFHPVSGTIRLVHVVSDQPLVGLELLTRSTAPGLAGMQALQVPQLGISQQLSKEMLTSLSLLNFIQIDPGLDPQMAVVNLGGAAAQIQLQAMGSTSATPDAETVFNAASMQQQTGRLASIFNQSAGYQAAFVKATSAQPLSGYALFLFPANLSRFGVLPMAGIESHRLCFPRVPDDAGRILKLVLTRSPMDPFTSSLGTITAYDSYGTPIGSYPFGLSSSGNFETVISASGIAWLSVDADGALTGALFNEAADGSWMECYPGIGID